jgi:hypothetical protein
MQSTRREILKRLLLLPFAATAGCSRPAVAPHAVPPATFRRGLRTTTWMADLAAAMRSSALEVPLNHLLIPGTHDSGTYAICAESTPAQDGKTGYASLLREMDAWREKAAGTRVAALVDSAFTPIRAAVQAAGSEVTARWARTQPHNVQEQLRAGIRYFDLRVQHCADGFYAVHSLRGASLTEILQHVAAFLRQPGQRRELVLLDFNHLFDIQGQTHELLLQQVHGLLGKLLAPRQASPRFPAVLDHGNVLVFYKSADAACYRRFPWLWRALPQQGESDESSADYQLVSRYPATHSVEDLTRYLRTYAVEHRPVYGPSLAQMRDEGTLYVLQCIRTENTRQVLNGVAAEVYADLEQAGGAPAVAADLLYEELGWATSLQGEASFQDYAAVTNAALDRFWTEHGDFILKQRANIVLADWYSDIRWTYPRLNVRLDFASFLVHHNYYNIFGHELGA